MMRIFLSGFLLLLFLQGCTQQGDNVVLMDPKKTPTGTLSLSDVVESIEYIPLKTNDECLIGEIRRDEDIRISDNYILVACSITGLNYLFSRTGEFIGKVGDRGNGPGEYHAASLLGIDEKSGEITLTKRSGRDSGEVMHYDLNGKYLHSTIVDRRLTDPITTQFNDAYIAMHFNNPFLEGEPPFNYSVFSGDYQLISEQVRNIDYVMSQRGQVTHMGDYGYYRYNGDLHVKNTVLNDTVYSINKEFVFAPKYVIRADQYSLSVPLLSDAALYQKEFNNLIFLISVFETSNYVLISYQYNAENYYQYYNKTEQRSLFFNSRSGIPNDYDGGLSFWPKQQIDNILVSWYDAHLFLKIENAITPKGSSEAIDQLKEVTMGVKDYQSEHGSTPSPVIVIAHLKNNV